MGRRAAPRGDRDGGSVDGPASKSGVPDAAAGASDDGAGTGPGKPSEEHRLRGERGGSADTDPTGLDRLIHERVRLGILSSLAVNATLTFSELKELLGTTDGNLSVHARKLEEAGYVACRKSFHGRLPRTEYALTAGGRRALERYLDHMEALIQAVRDT